MPTELDIVNNALVMLGVKPLDSVDQTTDQGTAAVITYATNRDSLLRKFPWNFARRQLALNQLATAPISLEMLPNSHGPGATIYTIAFAAPTDMLRLYRWAPEYTHWRLVSGIPFNFQGYAIITDAVPAPNNQSYNGVQPPNADGASNQPAGVSYIPPLSQVGCEYIARVEDPNLFDPMFTDTLIASMARDMAFALTGLESVQDRMERQYQEAEQAASAVNGMENVADQLYDTTIADVRFGYSSFWYNS